MEPKNYCDLSIKHGKRWVLLLLGLMGCHPKSEQRFFDSATMQHQMQRDARTGRAMEVRVIPSTQPSPQPVTFKARLFLTQDLGSGVPDLSRTLQYNVDSLFCITASGDTLWPDYVMPVANGQRLQPEYLVAFSPEGFRKAPSFCFSTNQKGAWRMDELRVSFQTKYVLASAQPTN